MEDAEAREPARDARLYRWAPEKPDALVPVRTAMPHGTLEAADLDGDGRDELLLVRDGAVDEVPLSDATPLRTVVRDDALGRMLGDPRAARSAQDAADPRLRLSVSGEFSTYGRGASGAVAPSAVLDLPVRVRPGRARIEVRTPEVVAVGADKGGHMLFATAPEPAEGQRLRTWLLAPEAAADARSVECWAQLPGAERPLDAAFAIRDGRPVLIVTTMSAERLDLFAEKRLRVFGLGGDRTRAGGAPEFVATTGLNLWQVGHASVLDLNRDGKDDLVIGYWKGLKRTIAALEVYRGAEGSSFAKPRTMEIDIKDGDVGFLVFGSDADGDGRPDLIVIADRQAVVFPGADAADAATRPVAGKASRRLALPPDAPGVDGMDVSFDAGGVTVSRRVPGYGTPRPMDLDGDGRVELVFAGTVQGRGRISVLTFRADAAAGATHSTLARPEGISYK